MLKNMRAVVTPQTVISDCMNAVEATGLGRTSLMDMPLPAIDHFGFPVLPEDYPAVSTGLCDMLDRVCTLQLPIGGEATMGLQKQGGRTLNWFYRSPLPGLAAVSSPYLPIQPGGGYVAVHNDLAASWYWLQQHGVESHIIQLYGIDALWVPLHTPDYGVGDGYYALCVVGESLFETISRLQATA